MTADQGFSAELVEALARFIPLWRGHEARFLPQGVSAPRLRVLAALQEHGDLTMGRLRQHVGGSPQNLTGLVDTLERDGAVQRKPHPTDRRRTLVCLANAARAEIAADRALHREMVAGLFAALGPGDQARLLGILQTLTARLEEAGR